MARLHDLKSLLDHARQSTGAAAPSRRHPRKAAGPSPHGAGKAPVASADSRARQDHHAPGRRAHDDIDLAAEFVDVKPLPVRSARVHSRIPPVPIAAQRLADEREALVWSKWGTEPSPSTWDIGQEIEVGQTHIRAGLGVDILARLRRGHWSVQGELDLHGLTVDEAHEVLSEFILTARARGIRCVRIIHGKGLSSRNREPVLKGRVRRWLAQWDDVLAYCEAPRHAGGSGAVLVLLRARG